MTWHWLTLPFVGIIPGSIYDLLLPDFALRFSATFATTWKSQPITAHIYDLLLVMITSAYLISIPHLLYVHPISAHSCSACHHFPSFSSQLIVSVCHLNLYLISTCSLFPSRLNQLVPRPVHLNLFIPDWLVSISIHASQLNWLVSQSTHFNSTGWHLNPFVLSQLILILIHLTYWANSNNSDRGPIYLRTL